VKDAEHLTMFQKTLVSQRQYCSKWAWSWRGSMSLLGYLRRFRCSAEIFRFQPVCDQIADIKRRQRRAMSGLMHREQAIVQVGHAAYGDRAM